MFIGIEIQFIETFNRLSSSLCQIQMELCNPDSMYGLMQRIVGVESAITLVQQFAQLRGYLEHILLSAERKPLSDYLDLTPAYIKALRKPVFMCVTARTIDLQSVLTVMGKVKWDVNHVTVQHSSYVDTINRVCTIVFSEYFDHGFIRGSERFI